MVLLTFTTLLFLYIFRARSFLFDFPIVFEFSWEIQCVKLHLRRNFWKKKIKSVQECRKNFAIWHHTEQKRYISFIWCAKSAFREGVASKSLLLWLEGQKH